MFTKESAKSTIKINHRNIVYIRKLINIKKFKNRENFNISYIILFTCLFYCVLFLIHV